MASPEDLDLGDYDDRPRAFFTIERLARAKRRSLAMVCGDPLRFRYRQHFHLSDACYEISSSVKARTMYSFVNSAVGSKVHFSIQAYRELPIVVESLIAASILIDKLPCIIDNFCVLWGAGILNKLRQPKF
jgi:hypothetical protein